MELISFLCFLLACLMVNSETHFYPYFHSDCVCSKKGENALLQCEGKFFATVSSDFYRITNIKITCNKTITSADLNHDYPTLMGLKGSESYELTLEDCPEPSVSYVRQLFHPKNKNIFIPNDEVMISNNVEIQNSIEYLYLRCIHRNDFVIAKEHLQSFSNLEHFHVQCHALKSLPSNLFQGTTPNLEVIQIHNTQIVDIPSGLFFNLTKLQKVHLMNNAIINIQSNAFIDCRNLFNINMEGNQLSNLEETPLRTREINLSRNIFREMPKIFKKHSNFQIVDLSQNLIDQLNEKHCGGFSKIFDLNISYNSMTRIHPNCFGSNLIMLDISGNSFQNLTENPIELKQLRRFYFKDNSILHFEFKQFFISSSLHKFIVSNSNVISIENETLHGFPYLRTVDFHNNYISSIPANLFFNNENIRYINFQRNMISSLPSELFSNNKELIKIDLSLNRISVLPIYLFPQNCKLKELDLSFNRIETIPDNFLGNITSLRVFNVSHNNVTSLGSDLLFEMRDLDSLDLSYNRLNEIKEKMFHPLNISLNIRRLYLQGNNLSFIPKFRSEKLDYLDLSRNNLDSFTQLFENKPLLHVFHLYYIFKDRCYLFEDMDDELDEDFHSIYSKLLLLPNLNSIDLSNNHITYLDTHFDWIILNQNLEKLNLSCNNLRYFWSRSIYILPTTTKLLNKLKVLDLSNNDLHLNDSQVHFDERSLTWGNLSPFYVLKNLEVLLLRNNSITFICLDWRIHMPKLKFLDVSCNKLHFLTHQDLIFGSISSYEEMGFGPYFRGHKLTVDLRNNNIRFVELPQRMLAILPKKNETKGAYGHVKMLIEDNPFECGCALFNLLRVIRYDVVLTTQLKRVHGHDWVLPAKLDIGKLSCSTPKTVRGKKLNNTEEWLHHLIPLFGLCTLQDVF